MPLDVGRETTLVTQAGFQTFVKPLRIVSRAPLDGSDGVELSGPLGRARMGWIGDRLCVTQTAGAILRPPLPILTPVSKTPVVWHGRTEVGDRTIPSGAKIVTEEAKLSVEGRTLPCRVATVSLTLQGEPPVELRTWFHKGSGLVQQEQRVDRALVFRTRALRLPAGERP